MKLPKSFYNTTSIIGAIIAGVSLFILAFLFILSVYYHMGSAYLGLFMFMIVPGFLIFGLLLIPYGMMRSNRRFKKTGSRGRTWTVIDMNDKSQRNAVFIFAFGTVVFLFLTAIGSYQAYHYSESVEFCGTLCHDVMEPEYVTYQNSPHVRVACAECHVGPGADWFVKSKLSGLYQVYSVIFHKYPQPIETPIHSLRPARETCEECHWPEKFYSHRLEYEKHYLADSANTEWNIHLRMKVGSSHSSKKLSEGIHWHINPNVKIEYIASDETKEYLPWVRYVNLETGDTTIYMDEYDPMDEETVAASVPHTMDCIDCHNRPSHQYLTPSEFVDHAIAAGSIPVTLPKIKYIAMQIFNDVFDTKDTAMYIINTRIKEFYEENYPGVATSREQDITEAIAVIQTEFSKNIFPYMKASWDVYPNHIGHMEYNGCFRCHNDSHVSDNGDIISKDCNKCHNILLQGSPGNEEVAPLNNEMEFKHPVDIDETWRDYMCSDCHRYLYL